MNKITSLRNVLLQEQLKNQNHKNSLNEIQTEMQRCQERANDINQNFPHHVDLKVKSLLSHEISTVAHTSRRLDNLRTTTCDISNIKNLVAQERQVNVRIPKSELNQHDNQKITLMDVVESNILDREFKVTVPGIDNLPDPVITTTINDQPIYDILQNTQNTNNNVLNIIENLQQAANTFNVYQNAFEAFTVLNEEKIRLCNNRKNNDHPEIENRKFTEKIIQLREAVENLEKEIIDNQIKADELGLQIENSSKDTNNLGNDLKEAQTNFKNSLFNEILEKGLGSITAEDFRLALPDDINTNKLATGYYGSEIARLFFGISTFGLSIYTAYVLKISAFAITFGASTYLLIASALLTIIFHLIQNSYKAAIIQIAKNGTIN